VKVGCSFSIGVEKQEQDFGKRSPQLRFRYGSVISYSLISGIITTDVLKALLSVAVLDGTDLSKCKTWSCSFCAYKSG
jgi:hypothetical protein